MTSWNSARTNAKSCTWEGCVPCCDTDWGCLCRKSPGGARGQWPVWAQWWSWQQWGLTASRDVAVGAQPVGTVMDCLLSLSTCCIWNTVGSFEHSSTREMSINWSEFNGACIVLNCYWTVSWDAQRWWAGLLSEVTAATSTLAVAFTLPLNFQPHHLTSHLRSKEGSLGGCFQQGRILKAILSFLSLPTYLSLTVVVIWKLIRKDGPERIF